MDRVLTRAGFEAWLAGKEDEAIVGQVCISSKCPVACYLHDQGHEYAVVREGHYCLAGDREFSVMEPAERFSLEPWAVHLVRLVDSNLLRETIDAATVRGLLAEIDSYT